LLTAVPAAGDSLPRVSISRNVTYATAGRVSLKLDVYRVHASQPRPAVVIVHSGGWSDGDKAAFADVATRLARSGFVAFSINYRLACTTRSNPLCGHRFPTQVTDVERAVTWVRLHARRYGVKAGHIGALGASAGANLGLMLATTGRGTERVQTVISWSGPPDLRFRTGGQTASAQITPVISYLGCDPRVSRSCLRRAGNASPVTHVTPNAPPTYLFNSEHEVTPLKGVIEMRNLLHHERVPVRLTVYAGQRHAAAYASDALPPSIIWLHRFLGF
jgi:acetyl esterase/lipase